MTEVHPPDVSLPDGWEQTEDRSESLYELGPVSVRGHTVVYEDAEFGAQVAAATDGATVHLQRFFFATRLRVTPETGPSKALTKLVTSRARSGFTDRLADRGVRGVESRDTRSLRVGGADATLVQYGGISDVDGVTLSVEGYLAVWPTPDDDYLVVGGAYPTAARDADGVDDERVASLLDPRAFRDGLLSLIRSTR